MPKTIRLHPPTTALLTITHCEGYHNMGGVNGDGFKSTAKELQISCKAVVVNKRSKTLIYNKPCPSRCNRTIAGKNERIADNRVKAGSSLPDKQTSVLCQRQNLRIAPKPIFQVRNCQGVFL
jgi:hypothetical protein